MQTLSSWAYTTTVVSEGLLVVVLSSVVVASSVVVVVAVFVLPAQFGGSVCVWLVPLEVAALAHAAVAYSGKYPDTANGPSQLFVVVVVVVEVVVVEVVDGS